MDSDYFQRVICDYKSQFYQVLTPYTEDWGDNKTAEWYAGKKVKILPKTIFDIISNLTGGTNNKGFTFRL